MVSQFSLWDAKAKYISIFDRPKSVLPKDNLDYDFSPRPLEPLPPVPLEVFIHYLRHPIEDPGPNTYVWVPRLPKRIDNRIADCDIATCGWGIYIRDGSNQMPIFLSITITTFCSILLCILWTWLKGDAQGGSGLASFILTVLSMLMTAYMLRPAEFD